MNSQKPEVINLLERDMHHFIQKLTSLMDEKKISIDKGVSADGVRVFYGNIGSNPTGSNMEGSLYIKFDENLIRFRWRGDNAMYVNNTGNYFVPQYKEGNIGTFSGLNLGRLGDASVIKTGADCLEIYKEDEAYQTALTQYYLDKGAYDKKKESLRFRIGEWFDITFRGVKPLEEPKKPKQPENKIVDLTELTEMVNIARSGFQKGLVALEAAA
jgi:hypothetical protein